MEFILKPSEADILIDAIDTYGERSQEDMLIEEMSELTKALIKHRRYNTEETRADILEEIADVQITLMQLIFMYENPAEIVSAKLQRLKQRTTAAKREAFEETQRKIFEYFACKRDVTE